MEEVKLYPGSIHRVYSQVYTSVSGFQFTSSGSTKSYGHNSYYSLTRICDGNLKNAYIVQSQYTNVNIVVTLPRDMYINRIRLYPVRSKLCFRRKNDGKVSLLWLEMLIIDRRHIFDKLQNVLLIQSVNHCF